MAIKQLTASNFKSFRNIKVNLNRFNVLIGANASGKSNFVQIFKFLRDLAAYGIENAISMQGGAEYLLNIKAEYPKILLVEFSTDLLPEGAKYSYEKKPRVGFKIYETTYRLKLNFGRSISRFDIEDDKLTYKCNFGHYYLKGDVLTEKKHLGKGEIVITKKGDDLSIDVEGPQEIKEQANNIREIRRAREILGRLKIGRGERLILGIPYLPYFENNPRQELEQIAVYDFDPKLSKRPQTISGRADLEEDGSNLAVVINNLVRTGNKRKLCDLLTGILPFIDNVSTRRVANTLIFHIKEKYHTTKFLPSFLVSDGTMNLTALIIALFFEKKSLKIIEEPERNIHPYLISRVMELMRDTSETEQILTTSHNPEVVRYANPNEILLAKRSDEGFTDIYRPAEYKDIKTFLNSEMGMSELYVQRLLEEYTR